MMRVCKAAFLAVMQVLLLVESVSGQENIQMVQIPPSPDAGHLGTYGEFSVNMATGSADVSIPILTLQEGGITIPINLSYQSAGLRVDDQPSWVGMGWVLSKGGVISRTMRCRWDDMGGGFLRNLTSIPVDSKVRNIVALPSSSMRNELYVELDNISKNKDEDYEPDAFSFNFDGHGGSFFFGNDGNVHCAEHSTLKFTPNFGTVAGVVGTGGIIVGWTVIDNDGLVYTIDALELNIFSIS